METIDRLVREGEAALNSGDTRTALSRFSQAAHAQPGVVDPKIEQQVGICYRLLRQFDDAEASFRHAFEHADDDVLRGRIKRDWGMVFLDQDQAELAMELFGESLQLLHTATLTHFDHGDACTEYFVTMGFVGRAYLMLGHVGTARMYLQLGDMQLRGRAPYELNNLVWLLKASPLRFRRRLLPRAWKLAREAGHRSRQVQVVLTALSPSLAHFIEVRR